MGLPQSIIMRAYRIDRVSQKCTALFAAAQTRVTEESHKGLGHDQNDQQKAEESRNEQVVRDRLAPARKCLMGSSDGDERQQTGERQ